MSSPVVAAVKPHVELCSPAGKRNHYFFTFYTKSFFPRQPVVGHDEPVARPQPRVDVVRVQDAQLVVVVRVVKDVRVAARAGATVQADLT